MSTVFIIAARSGSGKSTLVGKRLASMEWLLFSISYTTRPPRGGERQGENYFYVTRKEFEERAARGEFLEWAEVFGNYYGTHRGVLERAAAEGKDLILDIDVQGARQLREALPEAVSIFFLAPSRPIFEQRPRSPPQDSESGIETRLREAAALSPHDSAHAYLL